MNEPHVHTQFGMVNYTAFQSLMPTELRGPAYRELPRDVAFAWEYAAQQVMSTSVPGDKYEAVHSAKIVYQRRANRKSSKKLK